MEKVKELATRKEQLQNDLTLLCEFFHDIKHRDPNMVRAKYERVKVLEQECYNLFSEIIAYNATRTNPKEELSMKDRSKIIDLVDVIRAAFLKFQDDCKLTIENQNQNTGKHSLRKIQLPYFEGSIEGWLEFKTLFDSLVHKNSALTVEEKFQYLKTHLKKSAASVISAYALEETNYKLAYNTLVERYHSPRRILNYYLQLLVKYKPDHQFNPQRYINVHEAAVNALKTLDVADLADFILFQLSYNNLDETHRQALELKLGDSKVVPQVKDLLEFIKLFSKSEELKHDIQPKTSGHFTKLNSVNDQHKKQEKKQRNRCSYCNGELFLAHCSAFKEKALPQRVEFITRRKLCTNCLGPHPLKECWSPKTCRFCKGKHHSWLHVDSSSNNSVPSETTPFNISSNHLSQSATSVVLATAIIVIKTESGYQRVRALIDPGSEATFISEAVVQRFKIPRRPSTTFVSGVGDLRSTKTRGHILLEFKSIYNTNVHVTPALILNQLSEYIPPKRSLNNINLADLEWADDLSSNKPIEIILGAEIYPELILEGVWKSAEGTLLAQATTLGWILSGTLTHKRKYLHCCSIDKDLLKAVERFWTVEEPNSSPGQDDQEVENYYRATTTRDCHGRFIVRLPFKGNPTTLGESLPAAKRSNLFLQRKLQKSCELTNLYEQFMLEYHQLDHMEKISSSDIPTVHYFLPHHTVLRPSSITTKLRVVFNASKPTSSGVSLNEILHVGPQLLPTLQDIILRWRRHRIVFSADIEKMYRQILVHDTDRNFQLICWSSNNEEQFCRLKTVTYGTACAPYLAIRTLHQLAEEEKDLPRAAKIIKRETYMDDILILTGANNISEALSAAQELIELLRRGGFPLQKWSTNSPELETYLPPVIPATIERHCIPSELHSMLGLKWKPHQDLLIIQSSLESSKPPATKRGVLSSIAKLFDPLGYAAPTLIQAKIFLQSLWLTKLSWDDILPNELAKRWQYLYEELSSLYLELPRWLGCSSRTTGVEIFGFSDASEHAMAAALYLASPTSEGKEIHLLGAKTKLAPIKQISLPRLELNAALLLVRLVKKILSSLELESSIGIYLWSDSTTVLSWIKGHPSKWQTYIANRVSEIQTSLPAAKWFYVPSNQNPADCATRGLSSRQLREFALWWIGPTWATRINEVGRINPI